MHPKKPNDTDMSFNGGGGLTPCLQLISFVRLFKEKRMQNVLKRKKYTKILCDVFARASVKNFFPIFNKLLKFFKVFFL